MRSNINAIGHTSDHWEHRLGAQGKAEQWQREERGQFIVELWSSSDGQTALEEAKLVADALTQPFGSSEG